METDILRWLHVMGACVLLGTGAGIAFFMLMAHRTGKPSLIAHTAGIVVVADWIFTASAVVLQPITGIGLAHVMGWSLTEPWLQLSLILYVLTGLCWLPVVWIQYRLKNLTQQADGAGTVLPKQYFLLFKIWFALGVPAFVMVLGILWLMTVRPSL